MKKREIFELNYFSESVKFTFKFIPKNLVFVTKIAIYSKFMILMQK